MEIWEAHLEEIKSMRDEINWRVKIAYTSLATFISAVVVILGLLLNKENDILLKYNQDYVSLVILAFSVLISMFVGILNANHLVEKKIELYTLNLLKKIFFLKKEPVFFWVSYLYGFNFKRGKVATFLEKLFSASVGLFQYAIPNFLAIGLLIGLAFHSNILENYLVFNIVACILVSISFLSSVFLGLFLASVSKEHSNFYKNVVKPYLDNNQENNQ